MNYKKLFTMVPALLCLNNSSWGMNENLKPIEVDANMISKIQNLYSYEDQYQTKQRLLFDTILKNISSSTDIEGYKYYDDPNKPEYAQFYKSHENVDFTKLLCAAYMENEQDALLSRIGIEKGSENSNLLLDLIQSKFEKNGLFYNALIPQIEFLNINQVLSSQDNQLKKDATKKDIDNINREISNLIYYLSKSCNIDNPTIGEQNKKIDFITPSGSSYLFNPNIYTILNNKELKEKAKSVAEVNLAFELLKIKLYQAAFVNSTSDISYGRYRTILQCVKIGQEGDAILNIDPNTDKANSPATYKNFIGTYIDRNFNVKNQNISDKYFALQLKDSWRKFIQNQPIKIEDLEKAKKKQKETDYEQLAKYSESLKMLINDMVSDKEALPKDKNLADKYDYDLQKIRDDITKNISELNNKGAGVEENKGLKIYYNSFVDTYNDILAKVHQLIAQEDNPEGSEIINEIVKLLKSEDNFNLLTNIVTNGDVFLGKIVKLMETFEELKTVNLGEISKTFGEISNTLLPIIQKWNNETIYKSIQLSADNNDVEDVILMADIYNDIYELQNFGAEDKSEVIKQINHTCGAAILQCFNGQDEQKNDKKTIILNQINDIFKTHHEAVNELTAAQLTHSIDVMASAIKNDTGKLELLDVDRIKAESKDQALMKLFNENFNPDYMIDYQAEKMQVNDKNGTLYKGLDESIKQYDLNYITILRIMLALSRMTGDENSKKLNFYSNKLIPQEIKALFLQYDLWEIANAMNTISFRVSPKALLNDSKDGRVTNGITRMIRRTANDFIFCTNEDKRGEKTGWHITLKNALDKINTILSTTDLSVANINDILQSNINNINDKALAENAVKQFLSIVAPINCIKNVYASFWPFQKNYGKDAELVVDVMKPSKFSNNLIAMKHAKIKNSTTTLFKLDLNKQNITSQNERFIQNDICEEIKKFVYGNNNPQQSANSVFGQELEKLISDLRANNELYKNIDDTIQSDSVQQILKRYKKDIESSKDNCESTPQGQEEQKDN